MYYRVDVQIMKILKHQSVRGLSMISFELEVIGYTIALAYCLHKGLPFSAYGELLFLLIQGVLIVFAYVLVSVYSSCRTLILYASRELRGIMMCVVLKSNGFVQWCLGFDRKQAVDKYDNVMF